MPIKDNIKSAISQQVSYGAGLTPKPEGAVDKKVLLGLHPNRFTDLQEYCDQNGEKLNSLIRRILYDWMNENVYKK